jgi:hypothetical protein
MGATMKDHEVLADENTGITMSRYVMAMGRYVRQAEELATLRDQLAAALVADPYERDLVAPDLRPLNGGGWLVARWKDHQVDVVTIPHRGRRR